MIKRSLIILLQLTVSCISIADTVDENLVILAMGEEGRLEEDIARDQRSKPEAIIPLLNLQTGDRVIDIFAGGGYYTELLASVLGKDGEVILHNNNGFEAWGINGLLDRFKSGRDPGNIVRLTRSGINLDLKEESINGALIVMAYHDLYVVPKRYNGEKYVPVGDPANTKYFLEQVFAALKPGGRFVIVDHAGDETMNHNIVADLHRIKESFTRSEIKAAGFRFVDSTDALRNPEDDRNMIVFDLDVQGRTDRFTLAFEKPEN